MAITAELKSNCSCLDKNRCPTSVAFRLSSLILLQSGRPLPDIGNLRKTKTEVENGVARFQTVFSYRDICRFKDSEQKFES
jgi:hypothetical protein